MSFLFLSQFLFLVTVCVPVESETLPRGVNRAIGSFYKPGSSFTCLDGSVSIPYSQVNDDFCDCEDGTDEPGTAACSNGKFFCVNAGYRPENIPSSRVSDGVCDCCDGSDEYEGKAKCQDTCMEMGKVMREEFAAMKAMVEEGHRIRAGYSQQGQEAKAHQQQLLVELGPQRDQLRVKKEDLMAKKEEAEKPEKEAKDEFDAWQAEQKAKKDVEADRLQAEEAFKQIDSNSDQSVSVDELQSLIQLDKDGDGTVTKEEVTENYMIEMESADMEVFVSSVWPKVKQVYAAPSDSATAPLETPPTEEEQPSESADDDDDDSDFDEEDFDENDDNKDAAEEEGKSVTSYPEETQRLIETADAARAAYTEAEQQYNEVDKQVQDVERFMELDLGPDDVFYPLKSECFEYTDREYTYKFCPYEKATQRSKSGGTETNLGSFTRWEANGADAWGFMKFEKGLHCWNGPDRSATVRFVCGRENSLTNAAEPNRCEYSFDFSTPAACHQLMDDNASAESAHLTHTEL